ncbi:N-acetylmuramoyl-L-alanine amidase [bacterium]|nr:N-acetylmuramoyl-L-alanine amidase [bacterium]
MKKIIFMLLTQILLVSNVNAATIVYPKSDNVTINSECTFFIGNENPERTLTINGQEVKLHKTGAFKHAVDLEYGENIFEFDNGIEKQTYIVKRGKATAPIHDTESFEELTKNQDSNFASNIKQKSKSEKIIITIDPGHGGNEFGAIGCLCEKEKDVNLQIANKLKKYLEEDGFIVFMTREDDKYVGLRERVNFANSKKTDIFLSIHCNALPDSRAKTQISGSEVYYLYPQSKELAQNILKSLGKETGLETRGVYQRNFAVVRNPNSLAVLVEVGYIIDPTEEEKLINHCFQQKAAKAIMQGVKNYLK